MRKTSIVSCPDCGKSFKLSGIHNHRKRVHEGQVVNYNNSRVISEDQKQRQSATLKEYRKTHKQNHTEETKKKLSEIAKKQTHRRLLRSTRMYNGVMLDSSWEEALAVRLDELGVKWIRPSQPLKYTLNEEERNYFPDFYLPDFDLYLDPKNPHAFKVQKPKIDVISTSIPNLVFIRTLDECKSYVPIA